MAPLQFVIQFERELYEDAALALARRLFARFDERIDSLTLVPIPEEIKRRVMVDNALALYGDRLTT